MVSCQETILCKPFCVEREFICLLSVRNLVYYHLMKHGIFLNFDLLLVSSKPRRKLAGRYQIPLEPGELNKSPGGFNSAFTVVENEIYPIQVFIQMFEVFGRSKASKQDVQLADAGCRPKVRRLIGSFTGVRHRWCSYISTR